MLNKILLPMLCAFSVYGQRQMDIKTNILDQVQAQRIIQTPSTYNLKGRVKQVVEENTTQKDTLFFAQFSESGQSSLVIKPSERTTFTYTGAQLESTTIIRNSYPYDTVVSTFNAKGQLEKSVARYMSQQTPEETVLRYSYSNDWRHITVAYSYSFDESKWDVVKQDKYTVTYDQKGRVSSVKNESVHDEFTYAYTRSYAYDKLDRITAVNLVDRDAGSNSALSLHLSIFYDDKEHSMTESMTDATIRNSLWSYGYTQYERYNEHGDVVVIEHGRQDDEYTRPPLSSDEKNAAPNLDPTFEYDYDAHGNWTVKYAVQGTFRFPAVTRTIEYYVGKE